VQCCRLTASLKQSKNNRQTQGSASGYLEQLATRTNQQGCERLLEATESTKENYIVGAGDGHFEHS